MNVFKSALLVLALNNVLLYVDAGTANCKYQDRYLFNYNYACTYDDQCTTGVCFNSKCDCATGTAYSTCAEACVPDCGTTVAATHGFLAMPDKNTMSSFYCTWTIRGIPGTSIAFNLSLDTGDEVDCSSNYMELFDGPSSSDRSFGKMCSTRQTLSLSTQNYMHVVFSTSGSARFLAIYYRHGTHTVLDEPTGFISSPGYSLDNNENMFYTWTIQGNVGTYVVLNITDVQFEGSCNYDHLTVYEGVTNNSSPIQMFCTSSFLEPVATRRNFMFLVLKTSSGRRYKGFYGYYEMRGTSNVLDKLSGLIVTPGFPRAYLNNETYVWLIESVYYGIITLTVKSLNLGPASSNCNNDYLEISFGQSNNSKRLCGNIARLPISFTSNKMTSRPSSDTMEITFGAGNYSINMGFYAEYSIIYVYLQEDEGLP